MKKILALVLMLPFTSMGQSVLWKKAYGGKKADQCKAVQQTTDGGYILSGQTGSTDGDITSNHGGDDCWLVKTDATGTILWQKTYGGTGNDEASAVLQTTDGGYIFAGVTGSTDGDVTGNHGSNDFWVVKTDATGTLVWQKTYGGTTQEYAETIEQTADGGYVICGTTGSSDGDVTGYHGSNDIWVVKIDATGTLQWQKCLGDTHIDAGYAAKQTADGGYMVAGYSSVNGGDITGNHGDNDYWVVKLDAAGTLVWQKSLGGSKEDRAFTMDVTKDGGCIVGGYTVSTDGDVSKSMGYHDAWIVKLDNTGTTQWEKSIGGSFDEQVWDIAQTKDGGYILAIGSASQDNDLAGVTLNYDNYFIVKLNPAGNIEWKKVLGGQLFDVPYSIKETSDGNYIVAGSSISSTDDVTGNHGSYDCWVVKLAPTGTTGVNTMNAGNAFFVYPNPATTYLYLSKNNGTTIVYDITGRSVGEYKAQHLIDIRALNNGLYYLKYSDSDGSATVSRFEKL